MAGGHLWRNAFRIETDVEPRRPPPGLGVRVDVEMRVIEAPPGFGLTDP